MQIKSAVLRSMGAAYPYANSKPLTVETLELQPPGPGEVLVKVAAAGLGHSDLSVINGSRPLQCPWRSAMRRPGPSSKWARA